MFLPSFRFSGFVKRFGGALSDFWGFWRRPSNSSGKMQRASIRSRLDDVARRYEADILNHQPLKQFAKLLEDCEDREVFHGLIHAFEESGYLPNGFWRQQVAGRMLVSRRPKPDEPISGLLVKTAPNYNLSVEEFPWYLALAYGREAFRAAVKECLQAVDLPERERKSLDCYLYWTGISEDQILAEIGVKTG